MFLSNVGNSKKNKSTTPKKAKDNTEDAPSVMTKVEDQDTKKTFEKKVDIKFREGGAGIPRDNLIEFLVGCSEKMGQVENIVSAVEKSKVSGVPLHQVSMEFQRDIMEYDYGIERNYGCRYLAKVPQSFPGDKELIAHGKEFIFACMNFFLNCIEERAKIFEGKPLKTSGTMPIESIHEFFEACNALMQRPETKQELHQIFVDTKKPPNERVIELQRSILNLLGWDADFACEQLNNLGTTHGDDRVLHMRFQHFAIGAQCAVEESQMNDVEKEAYYEKIPPFLHYTPQVWALQKRQQDHMMQQHRMREMQERQQQEQQSLMQDLMNDPERLKQVQNMKDRILECQPRIEEKTKSMSVDEKKQFMREFVMSPLMKSVMTNNDDVASRLQNFMDMSDEDMNSIVTFQSLAKDDDGTLLPGLKGMRPGGMARSNGSGGIMGTLSGLMSNLGLGSGGGTSTGGHDHSHGHSHTHINTHDHVHGPNCNHGRSGQASSSVAKGETMSMDR
jgi:hypothetical protein